MLTWEDIERLRDVTFHRTTELQIRSVAQAEAFINKVGFCFAFQAAQPELPCLWHAAAGERNPAYPLHVQHDPYIGLVWEAKDRLAATKSVYYGKVLKRRPSFISLEYFPFFYRLELNRRCGDYYAEYSAGKISREAKMILDALHERSPQVTGELKSAAGMTAPEKRHAFGQAMAELQSRFWVVKIGEFDEPFTFLWDLVERRFAEEIEQAKQCAPQEACRSILQKFFEISFAAGFSALERLFGFPSALLETSLSELIREGKIVDCVQVANEKKLLYGKAELL
ncbi:MAG: hypothetical protein ONB12_03345 [candidate division KSB1 bacterium]|nr:hypothetical protein [candidate division KSB1 bacterium]